MHIRKAPRFIFVEDDGAAYAAHINELLRTPERERRGGSTACRYRTDRGLTAFAERMDHWMTEQLDVQQMAQRLLAADNILILCHKNPDGDTIGCGSALYYALKALEKTTAVLCSDDVPSRYAFTNPRLFKGEFEPQHCDRGGCGRFAAVWRK